MKKIFGSLIFKQFISYMAIFILVITFSVAIYGNLSRSIEDEIMAANTAMLENMRLQMDSNFKEIYQLSDQISLNNDVRTLLSVSGDLSGQNYYDIYKVSSYLNNLAMVNANIDNINIYFTGSDTVVSNEGHVNLPMYYQLFTKKQELLHFTQQDMKSLFAQRQVYSIVALYSDKGNEYLLFMSDIFFPNYNISRGTIFVLIDIDKIMAALDRMKWNEDIEALLLDQDNRMICSTKSEFTGILPLTEGSSYTDEAGTEYVVSLVESQITNWKYVILTPEETFYKEVRNTQTFYFAGIAICGTLCVFAASLLTKRSYRPIKEILSVLQRKKNYDNEKNEYVWIKETMQDFLEESENVEDALARNRRTLKNNIVQALLSGIYKPDAFGKENIGLDIENGRFTVALFQARSIPELTGINDNNGSEKSLLFIMRNVVNEVLSAHMKIAVCEFEPYAAVIIEMPRDHDEASLDLAEDLIYEGKQQLKERFDIDVYVSLGEVHSGKNGIRKSYFEAKEAAEYGIAQNNSEILVHYNEIKNLQTGYYYPAETEARLLNALRAGNNESAMTTINEVLNRNLNLGLMSRTMKRCLVANIISSFFKSLDEKGNIHTVNNLELDEELYVNLQAQALEERLLQMAEMVCENNKKVVESEKNNDLGREVIAFIKENYHDNNLNVSMIGDHFKLTPAYVSKLFKEQTGEGLLNYINMVRVEEAKLLLEKGMNVTNVAEQTGFTNASGMIRIFKKMTGVTPGQMKTLM